MTNAGSLTGYRALSPSRMGILLGVLAAFAGVMGGSGCGGDVVPAGGDGAAIDLATTAVDLAADDPAAPDLAAPDLTAPDLATPDLLARDLVTRDLAPPPDLAPQLPAGVKLFVSPTGDDAWSGTLPDPNTARTDGPLRTLGAARDALRKLRVAGLVTGPAWVYLRGGRHALVEPLVLEPQDSGSAQAPVTFAAFPGERPVISGGRTIGGWSQQGGRWSTTISDVAAGRFYPGALFVDGERRTRARTPNDGFHTVAGLVPAEPNKAFVYAPGDLAPSAALGDALVVLYQSWSTELHRIASIDTQSRTIRFVSPTQWQLGYFQGNAPGQRYYLENVPEALDAPGEWYLERASGRLTYVPRAGEDLTRAEVIVPVLSQLVLLQGDPSNGKFIDDIALRGLSFQHTDFTRGMAPGQGGYNDLQAAHDVPAAIEAVGARRLVIADAEIAHTGGWAVAFGAGSQDGVVVRAELHDLGAGGVKLGTPSTAAAPALASGHHTVDNCFIHDGGRVVSGGVGVWIGRSSDNVVTRNEIADLDYTAVSVGWQWGYAPSTAGNNRIEGNHLHHLLRGRLSDGAGVYTLGISPGTVVRNNVVHDVLSFNPRVGGWGLYADEGSTGILWERNLVYLTADGGFHQHYGEQNVVRSNVFAYSYGPQIVRTREETHLSFTAQSNIFYFNNGWLLGSSWTNGQFKLDDNLYWDESTPGQVDFNCLSLNQWQATGQDQRSVVADPLFVDAKKLDFRLKPGSPAIALGFVPTDLGRVGLYGDPAWVARPLAITRPATPLPAAPAPITDGFETTPVGAPPVGVTYAYNGGRGGSIVVSGEAAATGSRSLKLTDAPGLPYSFEPHMYYQPGWAGTLVGSFKLKLGPGAVFYHEWRYWPSGQQYQVGPTIYIDSAGNLTAAGKPVGKLPINEWIGFKITAPIGPQAPGTWDLEVTLPSGQTLTGAGLPGKPLCRLTWWGFVSNADAATVFYLDDVALLRR